MAVCGVGFALQTASNNLKEFSNMGWGGFHHSVSRFGDRTPCEAMMGKRGSDRLKVTG